MHLSQKLRCVFALDYELPLIFNMKGYFSKHIIYDKKKGAQIDKLKKLLCPNLLNISKADVSRECDECSFNKTPTQSLAELSIKVGKISDDRGQWNIGWWCLMTNDWASGFCAGVTTVIYSCRSHQSEHFQCSPSSSHFNELGLCFNFAFPQRAISQKKYILHPRYINVIAPLNVCRTSDLEKWTSWKITSNALCRAWVGHTTKKSMTWSLGDNFFKESGLTVPRRNHPCSPESNLITL